jgi:hypothetical protein
MKMLHKESVWQSIQQVLRIGLYTVGGAVFGDGIADSEIFQQAIGGVMSIGTFVWWYVWERGRTPNT